MEHTDLLFLWGSNPRETHPIMFHHMLRGIKNGARVVVVDPRVSSTAEFADIHLQIPVGGDIALANAIGHVIIEEGLQSSPFIENATTGYAEYAKCVQAYTPERAEGITGISAERIR